MLGLIKDLFKKKAKETRSELPKEFNDLFGEPLADPQCSELIWYTDKCRITLQLPYNACNNYYVGVSKKDVISKVAYEGGKTPKEACLTAVKAYNDKQREGTL